MVPPLSQQVNECTSLVAGSSVFGSEDVPLSIALLRANVDAAATVKAAAE
jgi:hypothetical protein